ncbi:SAM-dependent methyltransferase [Ornithinimicrobium tianjinense]|uniref:Trans-aconitate methyltransferase n=1 Tax=Ornithinimicrobium tianjinense TaxID=1195761 RepID=A0A917BVN6_9MICO|nr:SAM-dependent methyltransferase [Ornithinimicrobium tianjinense]GGF57388.1 trans-aconitate methyltransferase [Ornithinimicrobium tianjinense]
MSEQTPVRADCGWLALRRAEDEEARDRGGSHLLARLGEHLVESGAEVVEIVDVGAGTGANAGYLRPRLPWAQEWVVVDHDADHLREAGHGDAVRVAAGVVDLPEVLRDLPPRGDLRLLTCAALLDVLSGPELERFADAVVDSGGRALLTLTVDGSVRFDPGEVLDHGVRRAFDAHQRRGGRPGPDAAREMARLLVARGLGVTVARTPWRLGPERPQLLRRWLDERVDAVLEEGSLPPDEVTAWHARRGAQADAGQLRVGVGHVDLLVLPHIPPSA